ncbi:hypothetical protein [Gracilimonas sp.]|uniref:hypothetical protein n=1 Tax=Gracilimonas sp. TaxID=1974203 RepID=UPI0028717E05|nr:hypothetical protein [Gracilimonas sp.]
MIILHKKESHKPSSELEQALDELVIAYEKEIHPEKDDSDLPYIEEDVAFYKETDEIKDWLQKLRGELNWQRSLSGDGCYIDPKDGEIC